MSEMIERVAKAMCERAGTDWSDTSGDEYAPALISRPFWIQQAQVAIEEMREPTMEMESAASNWQGPQMTYSDVWRAMIDEAMK